MYYTYLDTSAFRHSRIEGLLCTKDRLTTYCRSILNYYSNRYWLLIYHVHWSQSLRGAVRVHGFGDVPAHVHLQHLFDRGGKVDIGQEVVCRVVESLAPLITTLTAT